MTSPPLPLLGAAGGTEGSAGLDDHVDGPIMEQLRESPAPTPVAEGARPQEKYRFLVRIFTAHDRWSLEPHAWVEDLLKDFFQSILGVNLSVILLSPTECLIFCGNCTQGQGMSWDESHHYAHQLMGLHPWTGYMIDVSAHQRTLKEARHEMQVAREFTHKRTKQNRTPERLSYGADYKGTTNHTPEVSPGAGNDQKGPIDSLCNNNFESWNFDEPAFEQRPPLLGAQPESPEREQFDSAREDVKEEGGVTSGLDTELDASTGEETEVSGHPDRAPLAERRRLRNRIMQRERARARRDFRAPKNKRLCFPLF